MRRLAIILVATTVLAGCGTDHGVGDGSYDPRDSRIQCIAKQGLPAHKAGQSDVIVTPPGQRPVRVYFAATPGQAEALSVEARAQGAEQLGRALLYVGNASEPLLTKLEGCLDDN
jgi:hypothetical protein